MMFNGRGYGSGHSLGGGVQVVHVEGCTCGGVVHVEGCTCGGVVHVVLVIVLNPTDIISSRKFVNSKNQPCYF